MTWGIHHQYLSTPNTLGTGICSYKSLLGFKGQLHRFMNQKYIKSYYIQKHSFLAQTQVAGGWGLRIRLSLNPLASNISNGRAQLAGLGEPLGPNLLGCSYVLVDAFYSKSSQLLVDHSHTSSKIFLPWKSISGLTCSVVCTGVAIKCFNESEPMRAYTQRPSTVILYFGFT